jgi:hypothetical protein
MIPLHVLGVVDVAANDVPDNEVLANALLNVSQADKIDSWAAKRSSDFVSEHPPVNDEGSRLGGSSDNPNHLSSGASPAYSSFLPASVGLKWRSSNVS